MLVELCQQHTTLSMEEMKVLQDWSKQIQTIANISQADTFIDCLTNDGKAAIVIDQAHPHPAKSLYCTSVVGQLAFAKNEPAVMHCLLSGKPVIGSRGVSQEQIVMQQNVVPIAMPTTGKIIGCLITEQDISDKVENEKNVEILKETNEQLSETLLSIAMSEGKVLPSLISEGVILFNLQYQITYTNHRAENMLNEMGYTSPIIGQSITMLIFKEGSYDSLFKQGGMIQEEIQVESYSMELKSVPIYKEQRIVGGLALIRDISDIKEKEKQLMIKSAVIKEIHHRVKNNLQTVSSLLRLQMRRTDSMEIKNVYRDSINRINSIATIHEFLSYDGHDKINFIEVIKRITRSILSSMVKPEQTIHFSISGDPLMISSDKATTLALIINELVQNCVSHAFTDREEGNISIELYHNNQIVSLHVTDNGVGIHSSLQDVESDHLGLKIVQTLVQEDLDGFIEMNELDEGTQIYISFPIQEGVQA